MRDPRLSAEVAMGGAAAMSAPSISLSSPPDALTIIYRHTRSYVISVIQDGMVQYDTESKFG